MRAAHGHRSGGRPRPSLSCAEPAEHESVVGCAEAKPHDVPETQDLPIDDTALGFRVHVEYGMIKWFADLFTPRQLVALTTFADLVGEARAIWWSVTPSLLTSPTTARLCATAAPGPRLTQRQWGCIWRLR